MFSPFEAFALATVVLFVKMFAVAMFQAAVRTSHDRFAKPEDAEIYGDGEVADTEHPAVDRAQRTLQNDLENVPIFLFLAWCVVNLDAAPNRAPLYFGVFVVSRIAHTLFYLKPMQPYRTISYMVGILVSFALSGHVVYAVLAG